MSNDIDQPGAVVLVTGATSGIGKATAELLASRGYRVYGTSRNPAGKSVSGVELLPLEVASDTSVEACVRTLIEQTCGRIDVLVNNAGTGIFGAAEEVTAEEAIRLFQVNFFGVMRVTSAVLPHLREQRGGKIITMSSSGGVASLPFASAYCATKFALEAYMEALRLELRPLGIAATVIAPGPVSTPAGDSAMHAARHIGAYAERRQRIEAKGGEAIRKGMDPAVVASTILRVLRKPWPASRYPVGVQSRLTSMAKRILPRSAFEAVVRWGAGV